MGEAVGIDDTGLQLLDRERTMTTQIRPLAGGRPQRALQFAAALLLVSGLLTGCDFGLEPDDVAPQAVGDIPDLLLLEGTSATVDASSYFSDPEGGELTFSASSSDPAVAAVSVSGSVVTIAGVSAGAVRVVVTAMDPAGQSGQQDFDVSVPATPVVELTIPLIEGPESDGAAVPLSLSVPPAVPITVTYTLGVDSDASTLDADAEDFVAGTTGSVEIEAGATEAVIKVAFNDDEDIEPTLEFFTITLDNPASGSGYHVGARRRATGTIAEGVCDRTPEVQDAILAQTLSSDCSAVRDGDLGRIGIIAIPTFQGSGDRPTFLDLTSPEPCDADSPISPRVPTEWQWPGVFVDCSSHSADPSSHPHGTLQAGGNRALTELKSGDFAGLVNVDAIVIRGTELETLPPDVFAGLTNLQQLALIQNRVSVLPNGVFADLGALDVLALSSNRISEMPDDVFAGLNQLGSLLLDNNLLTAIPAGIERLDSLRVVWLNNNQLTELPGEGPAGLFWLQLGANRLTEVPTGWLSGSPGLTQLHLQQNWIEELPPFTGLAHLQHLYLFENRISVVPPGTFAGLTSLTRLLLAKNEIGAISPGAFSGLENLEWLALDLNRIGDLPADVFADLASLQRLWLSGNQLTELPPGVFSDLEQLGLLALAINQLTEVSAEAFTGLTRLQRLFLNENEISRLPADLLSELDSLELLHAPENQIAVLPDGFFLGHSRLRSLNLEDNPGSPFPLRIVVARTDSDELLAAGPGTVAGRLAPGAPFDLRLPLSVHGGQLTAAALVLRAGEGVTDAVGVTLAAGQPGTQVSAGPLPRSPQGFTGIALELGDPLVLFGELSNHAPVALRELPWFRLRVQGEEQGFAPDSYFSDPDGDVLAYTFEFSDSAIASASITAGRIVVVPKAPGSTHVTVTATDPGGLSASMPFGVSVRDVIPGSFDMEVVLTDSVGANLRTAFEEAAGWWMTILADTELPDVPADEIGRLGCDDIVSERPVASIDDVVVVIAVRSVDGPGGVLAGARPCGVRDGSMMPFMGIIRFDKDDLERLLERGDMEDVEELILHEMGHVLGIGSLWSGFGLLREPSLGGAADADTHFAGPLAVAAFDEAGGKNYDGGKVPVENQAGPGSGDVHWRQSILVTELMTPFASIGTVDPLSAITIQSLADMGYTVNVALADPYTLPGAAVADRTDAPVLDLRNDVIRGPIIVVGTDGRVVRVVGN